MKVEGCFWSFRTASLLPFSIQLPIFFHSRNDPLRKDQLPFLAFGFQFLLSPHTLSLVFIAIPVVKSKSKRLLLLFYFQLTDDGLILWRLSVLPLALFSCYLADNRPRCEYSPFGNRIEVVDLGQHGDSNWCVWLTGSTWGLECLACNIASCAYMRTSYPWSPR